VDGPVQEIRDLVPDGDLPAIAHAGSVVEAFRSKQAHLEVLEGSHSQGWPHALSESVAIAIEQNLRRSVLKHSLRHIAIEHSCTDARLVVQISIQITGPAKGR
jgi:hypothetical protein